MHRFFFIWSLSCTTFYRIWSRAFLSWNVWMIQENHRSTTTASIIICYIDIPINIWELTSITHQHDVNRHRIDFSTLFFHYYDLSIHSLLVFETESIRSWIVVTFERIWMIQTLWCEEIFLRHFFIYVHFNCISRSCNSCQTLEKIQLLIESDLYKLVKLILLCSLNLTQMYPVYWIRNLNKHNNELNSIGVVHTNIREWWPNMAFSSSNPFYLIQSFILAFKALAH